MKKRIVREETAGIVILTAAFFLIFALPVLEELWSGPAVIGYTNIAKPCDGDAAAHRLFQLRNCQAALPGPTIFAVLRDGRFCGIAGCPPVDAV